MSGSTQRLAAMASPRVFFELADLGRHRCNHAVLVRLERINFGLKPGNLGLRLDQRLILGLLEGESRIGEQLPAPGDEKRRLSLEV
jgi:hypothetical protein